jgi:hypothetical protein
MPLKWKKVWVSDETYESAGVFDVNNDGILDIVSGAFWYEGPDFRKKHFIAQVRKEGEYYDDFSTIPMDVNGDGNIDFVTGGYWGGNLRWLENPGAPKKGWTEHVICEPGRVETTRAWDIDGDGDPEIIPNTPEANNVTILKLIKDENGRGTGEFKLHSIPLPENLKQDHGLGCGDIAGNGRMDIV